MIFVMDTDIFTLSELHDSPECAPAAIIIPTP